VQKQLLIVANMPSDNTRLLAESVLAGARHPDIDRVTARLLQPLDTGVDDVRQADGLIIGTTENFGYMSGLIKDFFERIYYPLLEEKQGMPYALYVRAGLDGTGTISAVNRIITGLRWRSIADPLLCHGYYDSAFLQQAEELGMLMAASLEAGIA